jgi:signal transduction histidine kinase
MLARLDLLLDAGITIASGLDLEVVLSKLVEFACDLTEARYGALGVIDRSGQKLDRFITHGLNRAARDAIGSEPVGRGILGVLISDARPLLLDDLGADPRSSGFPPNHPPMTSFLGVPVVAGGRVFGNLYLTEKASGAFTEEDARRTRTLAAQAGVAIENAHLYTDVREHAAALERAVSELSSVQAINEAILSDQPQSRVLELICERARASVEARTVMIALTDASGKTLRIEASSGDGSAALDGLEIPLGDSTSAMALRARRAVRIANVQIDPQFDREIVVATDATAAMIVPLVHREHADVVLIAIDSRGDPAFTLEDEQVMGLFAARATLALGMARSLRVERERAEAEALLLAHSEREFARQAMLGRVVEAQEAERRRIARELHDDTGQSLVSVLMGLRLAEGSDDPVETRRMLAELRETITNSIRDLRALAVELRPTALDDFGLEPALERLTDTFARRTALTIELQTLGLEVRLPPAVETALYRIVQESLTNIAKHAGAGIVSVVAQCHTDRAVVIVEDDGRGFDTGASAGGLGLISMRERAELVGGTLRLESSPGAGTTIAVEVPL